MSISQILQSSLSGLTASQEGLAVISRNIANANTIGYSRQVVSLEQRVINGVSNGVMVGNTARIADDFLMRELQAQKAVEGEAKVLSDFYNNIQARFGSPGKNGSLSSDLAKFGAAMETLAINPEDQALRFNVVSTGVTVARGISVLAAGAQTLRRQADASISRTVTEVNAQLSVVFDLNGAIARIKAQGRNTAGLEDKRDLAITKLSKNIAISTFMRTSGEVTILAKGGLTLLDTMRRKLEYVPAATVSDSTAFGEIKLFSIDSSGKRTSKSQQLVSGGTSSTVVGTVSGGRLGALLKIRDKVLPDLGAQVTALAKKIRDEYNAIHNSGSSFPAVNRLTGTRATAASDAFSATGTMRIAVLNANGTLAAEPVDIDLEVIGTTTVGSLVTAINTALGTSGNASIVKGKLVISAADSTKKIAINTKDSQVAGTTQGFSHFFGLNDFFIGTGSSDFAVCQDIIDEPIRVSTGRLSLKATLGQSGITVGDSRVITTLAGLSRKSISFSAVTGLPAGSFTLEEYAGAILGLNAVQASRAKESAEIQGNLLKNLELRKTSSTGVNVDEELAKMLSFQNSFAASARVFRAAQALFDSLLSILK